MSQHKVAFITGATSGIGQATARRLASQNQITLVLNGRRGERLEELSRELRSINTQVYCYTNDVNNINLVPDIFGALKKENNITPNIAILCAGLSVPGSIINSDSTKWLNMIETNYISALYQLKNIAKVFIEQSKKDPNLTHDIVVMGSTVGRELSAFNPIYGSTKFAIHSLVEALRQEICEYNIRVTLVEPGFVKTEFQEVAGYDQVWIKNIEKTLGQFLTADDIARSIEFILTQPPHVHIDDIRIRPTKQKV